MKKLTFFLSLLFVASTIVPFTSCEKDDDSDDDNTDTTQIIPTPPSPDPVFPKGDAAGVMVGIKTVTYQNNPIMPFPIEVVFGTATAFYPTVSGDFTSFQNAGTVSCNDKNLKIQANNSYVFIAGILDQEGIDFENGSDWDVSGAGTIPTLNLMYEDFPDAPEVTSGDVNLAQDYTLTIAESIGYPADSIYFAVYGSDDYVIKTVGPNVTSVTFTSAEMANIGSSDYGIVQVTPYAMTIREISNKNFYLVNETANSKTVKIK